MKYESILSAQIRGIEGEVVRIETDISRGLHAFSIVGLGDTSIREARDRISSAIKNSGFISPKQKNQKVTIALGPAHIKKAGASFDVAMALCYLAAAGDIPPLPSHLGALGEVSLEGNLEKVRGTTAMTESLREKGVMHCIVPYDAYFEASLVEGINIIPCHNLTEAIEYIRGNIPKVTIPEKSSEVVELKHKILFEHILNQEHAKRALIIAALGKHNVLLYGSPGSGKTSLVTALQSIVPKLTHKEALEVFKIHSSLFHGDVQFSFEPPLRRPHHTSSYTSIIGGGVPLRPGEITLAHNGILFLDECAEFDRRVLESLRQPMEEDCIRINREKESITFPAKSMVVMAMNPCPCGFYGSLLKSCACSHSERELYRKKISGPLLDRFDICTEVTMQESSSQTPPSEVMTSAQAKNIIEKALVFRMNRLKNKTGFIQKDAKDIVEKLRRDAHLSFRASQKVINLARTIADIGESEGILPEHILEGYHYMGKRDFI